MIEIASIFNSVWGNVGDKCTRAPEIKRHISEFVSYRLATGELEAEGRHEDCNEKHHPSE
jgi:hypothetical protein